MPSIMRERPSPRITASLASLPAFTWHFKMRMMGTDMASLVSYGKRMPGGGFFYRIRSAALRTPIVLLISQFPCVAI